VGSRCSADTNATRRLDASLTSRDMRTDICRLSPLPAGDSAADGRLECRKRDPITAQWQACTSVSATGPPTCTPRLVRCSAFGCKHCMSLASPVPIPDAPVGLPICPRRTARGLAQESLERLQSSCESLTGSQRRRHMMEADMHRHTAHLQVAARQVTPTWQTCM
jgi:hypothetical protein